MAKKSKETGPSLNGLAAPLFGSTSPIQKEYTEQQQLFDAQPAMVRHFLEAQARKLAEASRRNQLQTTFMLPDKVVTEIPTEGKSAPVAPPRRDSRADGRQHDQPPDPGRHAHHPPPAPERTGR